MLLLLLMLLLLQQLFITDHIIFSVVNKSFSDPLKAVDFVVVAVVVVVVNVVVVALIVVTGHTILSCG